MSRSTPTARDILVNDYEFSYDAQVAQRRSSGPPTTSDSQSGGDRATDECQEHGQPLGNFTRINANGQVYGSLLAPISRNPPSAPGALSP